MNPRSGHLPPDFDEIDRRPQSRERRHAKFTGSPEGSRSGSLTVDTGMQLEQELTLLARRASRGDTSVEARIVELCLPRVLELVTSRIRDRESAREAVNDVMLAMLLALRRGLVRNPERLGAFLYGTTLRVVHNRLRRDRRAPSTQPIHPEMLGWSPGADYERADQIRRVQRALATLDPQDRKIIAATLVEGLKPGEIADRLGLPVEIVRQRKCRALKQLVEILGPKNGQQGPSANPPRQ